MKVSNLFFQQAEQLPCRKISWKTKLRRMMLEKIRGVKFDTFFVVTFHWTCFAWHQNLTIKITVLPYVTEPVSFPSLDRSTGNNFNDVYIKNAVNKASRIFSRTKFFHRIDWSWTLELLTLPCRPAGRCIVTFVP